MDYETNKKILTLIYKILNDEQFNNILIHLVSSHGYIIQNFTFRKYVITTVVNRPNLNINGNTYDHWILSIELNTNDITDYVETSKGVLHNEEDTHIILLDVLENNLDYIHVFLIHLPVMYDILMLVYNDKKFENTTIYQEIHELYDYIINIYKRNDTVEMLNKLMYNIRNLYYENGIYDNTINDYNELAEQLMKVVSEHKCKNLKSINN